MEEHDLPVAYGQHINAEITSQIMEASDLLFSILSLTPQKTSGGSGSGDSAMIKLIQELKEKIPETIDFWSLKQKLRAEGDNPLNVVLM